MGLSQFYGWTDCRMKFNISYPATGYQKVIDIDDDHRAAAYYDCRMSQEVPGEPLGEEFAGYVFRISGGNDKQGFPMKQGVLIPKRTRLLLSGDHTCFTERRKGYRRRKSVRGCIVQSDISVLNLVIVKKVCFRCFSCWWGFVWVFFSLPGCFEFDSPHSHTQSCSVHFSFLSPPLFPPFFLS